MTDRPDPDPLSRPGRRWPRAAGILIGLAAGLLLLAIGWWLWQEYNPFIDRLPAMREANALRDAARSRPLTDGEFDRAVAVAGSGEPAAVLTAVAVLELEAGRRPERLEKVAAVLARLQQDRDPGVRQSATAALAR